MVQTSKEKNGHEKSDQQSRTTPSQQVDFFLDMCLVKSETLKHSHKHDGASFI